MYISNISAALDEIILQSDTNPDRSILDKSILSIIKSFEDVAKITDFYFDEMLELMFLKDILFNNEEIEVYKIQNIQTLSSIHALNILAIRYEKAILVKLFLSNPLSTDFYLLCYKEIHKKIRVPKNFFIVSNLQKIKRFLYLVLSNGMVIMKNKDNSQFISRQIKLMKQFEVGLANKYLKNK